MMHPKVSKFDDVKKKIAALSAEEKDSRLFLSKLALLLKEGCRYHVASIYRLDSGRAVLQGYAGDPAHAIREIGLAGHLAVAIDSPKPVVFSNIEPQLQDAEGIPGMKSRIMSPVRNGGSVIALIEARSTGSRNFDEVDVHLLEDIARLVAARLP